MRLLSKTIAVALAALMLTVGFAGCAKQGEATQGGEDQVYNLTFTCFSANTTAYAPALDNWASKLKEESNGRLNITIHYGGTIAGPTDSVEVTSQGGADVCWSTVPLNASKFNLINLFATYGEKINNSLSATEALVKLFENNADIKKEFESTGLHICGVHALTPNNLGSTGKKFEKKDDFSGESVMAISATNVAVLKGLGAAPLAIATNDLYENYSKNVSHASIVDSSLYDSTSTFEQLDYLMNYNWATCVCFIGMNQSKFDSLPDDLKTLIDSKFEEVSFDAATRINENFQQFVGSLSEKGVEAYDITDELKTEVETLIVNEVEGLWKTYCTDNSIDGEKLKADLDKYVDEGNDKYGAKYNWFK